MISECATICIENKGGALLLGDLPGIISRRWLSFVENQSLEMQTYRCFA
jgi:hypothetical protein